MSTIERRQFYRIPDFAYIAYTAAESEDVSSLNINDYFHISERFRLLSDLAAIETEGQQLFRFISDQNRSISAYLKNLNRKIDLLAKIIVADDNSIGEQNPLPINLSEGGMSFANDKTISAESVIALKVLIIPAYIGFTTFARVISSTENKDQDKDLHPYMVHVEFYHLPPGNRQLLAKHILQRQIQLRRDQGQNGMH